MNSWLLYLLIVFAIGIGWQLGRRERKRASRASAPDYYLNHLLNDEPDRAVPAFIASLAVNADTLETHLALGGLLRRRGELEKAVVVHKNILAHARLSRDELLAVELELARDYLLAGLLDRAEELSTRLTREPAPENIRRESLRITLEIYEQEREWRQAIEVAQQLASGELADYYEKAISHYYCELAEEQLDRDSLIDARESVREAIGHDVNNPRTSLVRGRLDVREGHYDHAITALTRIRDQDPVFVPESLDVLEKAWLQGNRPREELRQYLESCLKLTPSISIVLLLAKNIRIDSGDEEVARFIAEHLKRNPTIRGLTRLIDLHIDKTRGVARENLAILRSFAEALVADKPAYRCRECGFEGKLMRWHCPQCRDWATIRPIFGLEGE